jgi:hypothetical protein
VGLSPSHFHPADGARWLGCAQCSHPAWSSPDSWRFNTGWTHGCDWSALLELEALLLAGAAGWRGLLVLEALCWLEGRWWCWRRCCWLEGAGGCWCWLEGLCWLELGAAVAALLLLGAYTERLRRAQT